MSVSTTSTNSRARMSRAAAPSSAPAARRSRLAGTAGASISRIDCSSSTIRIRGMRYDSRLPTAVSRPPASGPGFSPATPLAAGKLTRNSVPPPDARAHVDPTAVVGDDAVDDRQAEPGALAERSAERLEDRVEVFGRDPHALVFDHQRRRARVAVHPRCACRGSACRRPASPAARWSPGSRRSAGAGPRRPPPRPRARRPAP